MSLQIIGGKTGAGSSAGGSTIKQTIRGLANLSSSNSLSITIPAVNVAKAQVRVLSVPIFSGTGNLATMLYLQLLNATTLQLLAQGPVLGSTISYEITEWS